MRWDSLRFRLCLLNAAVLAIVLGGFGIAICWSTQQRMLAALDRHLAERARRSSSFWFPPLPAPSRSRKSPDPDYPESGFSRSRSSPPPRLPYAWPRPAGPSDPESERRAALQYPRLAGLSGRVFGPPGMTLWDPDGPAAAAQGLERYATVQADGETLRVLSVPSRWGNRITGVLQVAADMGEMERLWEGQARTLMALLPVALLVAVLGGLFLTDRALRPVRQVTQAAAAISAQDLSRRLDVRGRGELAEMAGTFNAMIARLEKAFEQQRQFTADASHELRTPLAQIKVTTSEALLGTQTPDEYRKALRIADRSADSMGRLIDHLLLLARSDSGQLKLARSPVAVEDVLNQALGPLEGREGPAVRTDIAADCPQFDGDEQLLTRLFANLIENAARHTPVEGTITLLARGSGSSVVVQVQDTGEGIPPEHVPRVCRRFYRVDAARSRSRGGSGLGLAICQSIVRSHGGTLTIDSTLGVGTTVTVVIPAT